MTVISGKYAYVNGVPCTQSWQATEAADVQTYVASCTGGGTAVTEGNVNWTGQITGIGTPPVTIMPGADLTFKGVVDNTPGDAITLDGIIRLAQLTITIPISASRPYGWTATFGAQGLLVPGTVGAADSTYKLHETGKNGKVVIDTVVPGTPFVVPSPQEITLVVNSPLGDYVDAGAIKRSSGPFEATVSIPVVNRELSVPAYAVNVLSQVDLFINATEFWRLKWVRWREKSNIVVDAASTAPIGYTINGTWSSVGGPAGSTLGSIKRPDGTFLFGTE